MRFGFPLWLPCRSEKLCNLGLFRRLLLHIQLGLGAPELNEDRRVGRDELDARVVEDDRVEVLDRGRLAQQGAEDLLAERLRAVAELVLVQDEDGQTINMCMFPDPCWSSGISFPCSEFR